MWCLWSAKGGSGCSVVAAAAAVLLSKQTPVLLVDLGGGGLASILGTEPGPVGLGQWMSRADRPVNALARMEYEVSDNLRLLCWNGTDADDNSAVPTADLPTRTDIVSSFRHLAQMLAADHRVVVVDIGDLGAVDPLDVLAQRQIIRAAAQRVTLVTKLCYHALVVASQHPKPDDVIVVVEPGRALRESDVQAALGVGPTSVVRWDPAVARAADSGLLARRLPRPLLRLPVDRQIPGIEVRS